MITTERAFDVLPDIVDMYEKMGLKEYSKKITGEYKKKYPQDSILAHQQEIGREVVFYIVRNSQKAKNEFFRVVSVLSGVTEAEAKEQSLSQTLKVFNELLNDNELMDFFSSAMK